MPRVPDPGEIVRADEVWEEAAGGGAVAAVQLARLAGACTFLTACGPEAVGRLEALGVDVHAADRATRRAFTHTDAAGERTITVLGERVAPRREDPLPWERLEACDAVYFTAGDAGAAEAARAARVLVATPRAYEALDGVRVDVLVGSGGDADEVAWAEGVTADHYVWTAGAAGGRWHGAHEGTWAAARIPGEVVDAYGCGDSFAAGLTFALGRGDGFDSALEFAARCGAACLTGRGPYGSSLPAP